MKLVLRLLVASFAAAFLAGCFQATTALEPQLTALPARQARIYVLRPNAWAGKANQFKITVNGKEVGGVANNSYLSIDRPPGKYTIKVNTFLDFGGIEHELEVTAGRSYYLAVNVRSSTFMAGGIVLTIPEQQNGRRVGQGNPFAGMYFGELDDAAGSTLLAQMKSEQQ